MTGITCPLLVYAFRLSYRIVVSWVTMSRKCKLAALTVRPFLPYHSPILAPAIVRHITLSYPSISLHARKDCMSFFQLGYVFRTFGSSGFELEARHSFPVKPNAQFPFKFRNIRVLPHDGSEIRLRHSSMHLTQLIAVCVWPVPNFNVTHFRYGSGPITL